MSLKIITNVPKDAIALSVGEVALLLADNVTSNHQYSSSSSIIVHSEWNRRKNKAVDPIKRPDRLPKS